MRMVFDAKDQYPSQWAAIESIAGKIGCTAETLRKWVRQGERDSGVRPGPTTDRAAAHQGTRARGARAAQDQRDPEVGQRVFRPGGARPPSQEVNAFIDEHRARCGVEPICSALQVAPSAYRRHAARQRNPALLPARAQRDAELAAAGAARVRPEPAGLWCRQGLAPAPARRRGRGALHRRAADAAGSGCKACAAARAVRTTVPDAKAACPLDRVNRQFKAERPNQLWVADFTYVSTWQGFVYVAFVVDVFARRIVGWRVSSSMQTDFVLDALEQALYARRPERDGDLVHHSDRGSQYVSIRYSERLAEAGIEPSVGSTGDSYDNALAETINGLYKAEIIHRRGPWKTREAVELATLEWVSWFNHHRLLEPIGYIPPAEAEANYWRQQAQASSTTKPAALGSAAGGLNHEYMAQPGGLRRPLRGAGREEDRSSQNQSDHVGLTQANRPPRNPVRFKQLHEARIRQQAHRASLTASRPDSCDRHLRRIHPGPWHADGDPLGPSPCTGRRRCAYGDGNQGRTEYARRCIARLGVVGHRWADRPGGVGERVCKRGRYAARYVCEASVEHWWRRGN